jgi:D-alanyl-D-alanine dipeptidase
MQGFKISLVLVLLLSPVFSTMAQEIALNRHGLAVIKDKKTYLAIASADSTKRMVELKSMVPGLIYDLRYATRNNFMKTRMYPSNTRNTFMRLPAARALLAVQQKLQPLGYGLKVWDAYRPYSVTEKFWEMVKDERYVANPAKGSGHNRGIAIDVTIIELATGKELDMGTGFDNFTDTAHHVFTQLSAEVLKNRKLLKEIMESCGFNAFESEWWHYSLPNAASYELLDLPFSTLKRLQ